MKLTAVVILTAGALFIGATAASAQNTNSSVLQPNPGLNGSSIQSLQPNTAGKGLGYSPPGFGISPGPSSSNPGGALPPGVSDSNPAVASPMAGSNPSGTSAGSPGPGVSGGPSSPSSGG
jgi:hypothetical protein